MSSHILIVYNPSSGRTRAQEPWKRLVNLLPDFVCTSLNIRTERAQLRSTLSQCDIAVAVGGDGTVREVIQELADLRKKIPLAILPTGSGNLLARSLHLPSSPRALSRLIRNGTSVSIDLAQLDTGEYFAGACALGYLSERVGATGQRMKHIFGFAGYLWFFFLRRRVPQYRFSIRAGNRDYEEIGHSVFILNASNLFGIHSRNVESLHDGLFELTVAKNKSLFSFLRLVHDFYFERKGSARFSLLRGNDFTVACSEPLPVVLDGEMLHDRKKIRLTVLPAAQRIMVSKAYSEYRR
ncbi:MAG: NAD(+)/NADH kinase [Candidatus Komeilibacteria bacterium]|nr:NAD(+)/NADH kinase [Candidatus Komeilibacteria bacterium]